MSLAYPQCKENRTTSYISEKSHTTEEAIFYEQILSFKNSPYKEGVHMLGNPHFQFMKLVINVKKMTKKNNFIHL